MARKPVAGLEVEGLKELNRAVRRSVDKDLPKRMGQANKDIGRLVISKLRPSPDPAAVGAGAGASVRPSASKREVLLRVGGKHRAHSDPEITRMRQWGRRRVTRVGASAPPRPYIKETAERHRDEIERAYLKAISRALSGAFHDSNP